MINIMMVTNEGKEKRIRNSKASRLEITKKKKHQIFLPLANLVYDMNANVIKRQYVKEKQNDGHKI